MSIIVLESAEGTIDDVLERMINAYKDNTRAIIILSEGFSSLCRQDEYLFKPEISSALGVQVDGVLIGDSNYIRSALEKTVYFERELKKKRRWNSRIRISPSNLSAVAYYFRANLLLSDPPRPVRLRFSTI